MTLRNTSGKFSLAGFGRKVSEPISPTRRASNGNYGADDDQPSPSREAHGGGGGGGGGGAGLDGFGRKLKGSLAHNSLLPSLGNKDVRALQDIIALEKGVMQGAERLATDSQKAAAALPPYGIQEGPDLQDILTQSSTLLGQLTTALNIFASHQGNMRVAYKRIREREEQLAELRSDRRHTGQKADSAERKLAKMGPENKSLPQQTELLERLRGDMRTMDQDIITEETKIGDFKRQVIKEALSLKFGGLEELGEKMCIIGELGKLLLEEVPLEETPVGYGRAPYTGYEKTESAVNEATRCLQTVQFNAGSAAPKPPGLPQPPFGGALRAPSLPRGESRLSAAEEFANYPGNVASPDKGKDRQFSLETSNPYGSNSTPYAPNSNSGNNVYSDFGGIRGGQGQSEVMFNASSADHVSPRIPAPEAGLMDAPRLPEIQTEPELEHAYEYEQQQQIDADNAAAGQVGQDTTEAQEADEAWKKLEEEEAAWKEQQAQEHGEETLHIPNPPTPPTDGNLKSPWEPLNIKRGTTPDPITLRDGPAPSSALPNAPPGLHLGAPVDTAPAPAPAPAPVSTTSTAPNDDYVTSPTSIVVPPRPLMPTPGPSEFYTPLESSNDREMLGNFPQPGGKISAAAFRKGTKPRASLDTDEDASDSSRAGRRLPVPPIAAASVNGGHAQPAAGIALPASPLVGSETPYSDEAVAGVAIAGKPDSPPPQYHGEDSLR